MVTPRTAPLGGLATLRRYAAFALMAAAHMCFVGTAFAQPKQQDLISRGRSLFEDQQYEESIQTLSAAILRPNLAKEQKIEVLRLMALNYITLNRKDEAESAVRGLLAIEPTYELPKNESPRFRDFFATARKKWEADGKPGLVTGAPLTLEPVNIGHTSPSQTNPNTDIPLSIKMDDPQGRVYDVKLFYRTGSKGKFLSLATPIDAGNGKATIPRVAVKPPLVEYYFQGFDKGGLPIIARGDAAAPLRVAVPEPSKGWILPVVIGGGIVAVAAAVIIAGVVVSSGGSGKSTVSLIVIGPLRRRSTGSSRSTFPKTKLRIGAPRCSSSARRVWSSAMRERSSAARTAR